MASNEEKFEKMIDAPDSTSEFEQSDIEANKGMALLAYLGILVLVPLLMKTPSKFVRFHCNQGIILCVLWILAILLDIILPFGLSFIYSIVSIAISVLVIIGLYNVVKGRARQLPIVGGISILK